MPRNTSTIRRAAKVTLVAAAAAALTAAAIPAATASSGGTTKTVLDAAHPWRHGLVPTVEGAKNKALGLPGLPSLTNLSYGGGTNGVGVTTGAPKVYLVFWGSQWGTPGTDAKGYTTLTGDPHGAAPVVQELLQGPRHQQRELVRGHDAVLRGRRVAAARPARPARRHVGYPTGGALAGVWYDNSRRRAERRPPATRSAPRPSTAAAHFGNTTAASNRNAQYVILSPTGTHPDGFNTTTSQLLRVARLHRRHVLTGGARTRRTAARVHQHAVRDRHGFAAAGQNFVNSGSAGVTTASPSWTATSTPRPSPTSSRPAAGPTPPGQENGDKCAWISSGTGRVAEHHAEHRQLRGAVDLGQRQVPV